MKDGRSLANFATARLTGASGKSFFGGNTSKETAGLLTLSICLIVM
jgi:hypothetical protein